MILTTFPAAPSDGGNLTLVCQVKVNDLLNPSGKVTLQHSNGSFLPDIIKSPMTTIHWDLNPANHFGRYYCNASIVSPEFPEVGLYIYHDIILADISELTLFLIPQHKSFISHTKIICFLNDRPHRFY